MRKRHDILSGIIEGDPPLPYGLIPARAARCPHKVCRRARTCLSPEPPVCYPGYYLRCPMLSDDEQESWRVRVVESMRKRFGTLCTEPPSMLAGAREELSRRQR